MFEIFGFIIPLIVILVIVGIFLSFVPLELCSPGVMDFRGFRRR